MVAADVHKGGVALGASGVQVVIHQPRGVVALECEDHRQVIAQVVAGEVVVKGQTALVVATCDAADEFHLRVIVEIYLRHVVGELMALSALEVAVVGEGMTVHHGLDSILAVEHVERECTVEVGLHVATFIIMQRLAVHAEAGTLHGDAGAVVHHVAGEAMAVGDDELVQRLVVALVVEGHGIAFHL